MAAVAMALAVGLQAQGGAALPAAGTRSWWPSGVDVPFPFEIRGDGRRAQGSFFNGDRRITSTEARLEGNSLTSRFAQYASSLELTVKDGALSGGYRRARGEPLPVRAVRAGAARRAPRPRHRQSTAHGSSRRRATRARSRGASSPASRAPIVEATILRVDGDTGTLSGGWRGDRFVLSHFSGARPLRLEVVPQADGTLALSQNGQPPLTAARGGAKRAPQPSARRRILRFTRG